MITHMVQHHVRVAEVSCEHIERPEFMKRSWMFQKCLKHFSNNQASEKGNWQIDTYGIVWNSYNSGYPWTCDWSDIIMSTDLSSKWWSLLKIDIFSSNPYWLWECDSVSLIRSGDLLQHCLQYFEGHSCFLHLSLSLEEQNLFLSLFLPTSTLILLFHLIQHMVLLLTIRGRCVLVGTHYSQKSDLIR
jgi:hypothetical protein